MKKIDVAIIGAGLAGLSVAARLSRREKRTVIIDPAAEPGGACSDVVLDTVRFTPGPSEIFGFEPGGPLRSLCSEFGISLNLSQERKPYQVVLPDRRVTVYPEQDRTLQEMRREFPREIDTIVKLYRSLRNLAEASSKSRMTAYLARRRSASEYLRSYRLSNELNAFLNVQALIYFGMPLSRLSLDILIRLATFHPQNTVESLSGIAAKLGRTIEETGGSVRMNEPWPEILIRADRVTGVGMKAGTIDAKAVIVNTLKPGTERRWFLGVRPDVIPVGMHDTVLCLRDYNTPFNIFVLSLSDTDGSSDRNVRPLRVAFYGPEHDTPSDVLLDRMCSIIPFLRDFIETGGEEDLTMLSYPHQQFVRQDPVASPGSMVTGARSGLKQLYFIPDRYSSIGQSIQESQRLLKRIA